jgi:hypothetical protein
MSHTATSKLESPRLSSEQAETLLAARDNSREFPKVRRESGEDWVLRVAPDDGEDPERFDPY